MGEKGVGGRLPHLMPNKLYTLYLLSARPTTSVLYGTVCRTMVSRYHGIGSWFANARAPTERDGTPDGADPAGAHAPCARLHKHRGAHMGDVPRAPVVVGRRGSCSRTQHSNENILRLSPHFPYNPNDSLSLSSPHILHTTPAALSSTYIFIQILDPNIP